MVTRAAPLLFAVVLTVSACDNGFRPETLVENLRVLGIRSTPADLHPGETAFLQIQALDPSRPGQPVSTLWVGCDPDPFNLNRSACSDPSVLQDPATLGPGGGMLPPGVRLIGFNTQAAYSAPAGLFQVLPEGDERRLTGTAGQVLAISVAEAVSPLATMEELQALFARVQSRELRSLVALFRIQISENPERNHNPPPGALLVEGTVLAKGEHLAVFPGQTRTLDLTWADDDFEAFTAYTPTGTEPRTERILAAWYSTAGRFSESRTALREDVHTVFTAPGVDPKDPLPEGRTGVLYVTIRDTRGGQSWTEFPFFICDGALPEPEVTSVRLTDDSVTLEGQHLDMVLDVVADGRALDGAADAAGQRWSAARPGVAPTLVRVTTKRCTQHEHPVAAP
ncbi:MAG: hypothetical protein JNG84_02455 [Archangium sp.]|nr:hypothetical protein [Archangium sp.]